MLSISVTGFSAFYLAALQSNQLVRVCRGFPRELLTISIDFDWEQNFELLLCRYSRRGGMACEKYDSAEQAFVWLREGEGGGVDFDWLRLVFVEAAARASVSNL